MKTPRMPQDEKSRVKTAASGQNGRNQGAVKRSSPNSSGLNTPEPSLEHPIGDVPATVVEIPMVAPAPKTKDRLVRGGTSAGRPGQIVTNANRWRENYNPIRGLTMRRVVELFELAQRGDTAYLQWTFRFIERRYPTLSALIFRCESPMLNFDWDIKIKSELPPGATKEMADAQKQTLKDAYEVIDNLRQAIEFLSHADFRGYAHIQKHYTPDGDIYHLECLHQWCVCRDGLDGNWFWNPDSRSTSQPLAFLGKDFCIGGAALPLEDFIIREVSRPIDEIALVNFVRSNLCEKDADAFIEIYGVPGGVVTMPGNVPPGKESEYEAAAQKVAEGGSGAIPAGSEYTANDGPRGVDPFTPRFKHLDEQLIMAGTGGKLTMLAESGSGTLAGGAHEDTFDAIAEARALKVSECFQKQFDAGIIAQQHPGEPVLVYFEIGAKDETDVAALVTDVVALKGAGYKADTEWLSGKTGYELEEVEESETDPNADPVNNQGKITNRTTIAATSKDAKTVAAATAEDLQPIIDRLIAICQIQDDIIFERKLRQFHQDFPQLKMDLLKDPAADRAMLPLITKSFIQGLTAKQTA